MRRIAVGAAITQDGCGGNAMGPREAEQAAGEICVVLRGADRLECRAVGYITRGAQTAAYRALDDVLARTSGRLCLLWDSQAVEGFESGLPIALTQFLLRRVSRFSRGVLIARNPTIVAVGQAARRLIPPFPYAVVGSRSEGLAFLADT